MTSPSPPGVAKLDELEILVIVDYETDRLPSIDEGVPQIPEIVGVAAPTQPSGRHSSAFTSRTERNIWRPIASPHFATSSSQP